MENPTDTPPENRERPWRRLSLQKVVGGAVGCAIMALIVLLFTYILYVGYMYIQTH